MRLVPMDMTVSWASPTVDDYMIRCGKMNEYIMDTDISLHSIVYVRDALTKSQQIEFYLLPFDKQIHHTGTSSNENTTQESSQVPTTFCSSEADELLEFAFGKIPC